MTKVTNELLELIATKNAESQAWMDAEPGRWASMLVTNPEYWASNGIYTVEDYERDSLHTIISEASKEAYGSRMRINPNDYTIAELRELADSLCRSANAEAERQAEQEAEDVATFEASLQSVIDAGAGDRATALRWMTEGEEFYNSQDVDQWVWGHGILFTDLGKEVAGTLEKLYLEEAA